MINIDNFILIGIALPILIAPAVLFGSKIIRYTFMLIAIFVFLYLAYYNLTGVQLGTTVVFGEVVLAPVSFTEHPYSRLVVFGFTLVGSFGLLYGLQLSEANEQVAALLALASTIGVVFSDNFIILFIFWEMLTLSTAALILLRRNSEAFMAGYYFLFFHLTGGLFVLLGILQHYTATGSFVLTEPADGLIFFILGFGFKAAFIPLHVWLTRGYPTARFPTSVLLAGLTTKIGVYAIARILPPNEGIIMMGASMAVFGVICALMQNNMRRLLAFHIISQVGYMVAGVGLATSYAVDGALLHVVNHMIYKALLFMSVGAVFYATQTEDLHELVTEITEEKEKLKQNIWKAMPLVTAGAIVGALSISGFPFFNGYVSKYLLKNAMYGMGLAETMLLIASIGTAASFCKLIYFGFIKARAVIVNKIPISVHLAIIGAASFCIILGVYPQLISQLFPYASVVDHVYSISSVWAAFMLVFAGFLLFLILSAVLKKGILIPPWLSVEYLIFALISKLIFSDMALAQVYRQPGIEGSNSGYYYNNYEEVSDEALDEICQKAYSISGTGIERERRIRSQRRKSAIWNQDQWNIKNLNFDNLLLAFLLGIVLFIIFTYSR